MITKETEHQMIHTGRLYTYIDDAIGPINAGVSVDYLILPNKQHELHFGWRLDADGKTYLRIYELPTYSALGTPGIFYNRNRNEKKRPLSFSNVVYKAPTITGTGTLLDAFLTGSSGTIGGSTRGVQEWMSHEAKPYLFRVTSGAAAVNCVLQLDFYA